MALPPAWTLRVSSTAVLDVQRSAVGRAHYLHHTRMSLLDVRLNLRHFCYPGTFIWV